MVVSAPRIISVLSVSCIPFFALAQQGEVLTGPARVLDGDTFVINDVRVRLHGIDAPEKDQPCTTPSGVTLQCGAEVTREVTRRYQGQMLHCEVIEQDRYGRSVAKCFDTDGVDVGRTLVRDGLAYAFRRYSMDYDLDEKAAFVAGVGLHGFTADRPAAFRRAARAEAKPAPAPPAGGCAIKGNISGKGERIYHVPGQRDYDRTAINTAKGERWFCDAAAARAAGWRAARR